MPTPPATGPAAHPAPDTLRTAALAVLQLTDPPAKCAATLALAAAQGVSPRDDPSLDPSLDRSPRPAPTLALPIGAAQPLTEPPGVPGRPARPLLVPPGDVPTRSPHTVEGRAALLHAICHIEFNAINLALDAIWRFAHLPDAFYTDWLQVAAEEALHHQLLTQRLAELRGPDGQTWHYGSFEAHDGLWAMCQKTAHDVTARMALVPRTLEARGLDATPLIQRKLHEVAQRQGTAAADAPRLVAALDRILRDEVGHVAVGNRWYGWLCAQQGLEPVAHYRWLARQHAAPRLKPPFNDEARRQAGFTEEELADLHAPG